MSLEAEIKKEFIGTLVNAGMDSNTAKKIVKSIIKAAKSKQREEGTTTLPKDVLNLIMAGQAFHKVPAGYREQLLAEGVTDDDIRWWWTLPDLSRWALFYWEEHNCVAMRLWQMEKGLESEEAAREMTKHLATYRFGVSYEAAPVFIGENKRLPIEIKDRVDKYIENWRLADRGEEFKKEFLRYSSFNAFVREKMRAGEL